MVVRGNCHWPVAGDRIIVGKQLAGSSSRKKRIVAFVKDVVYLHKPTTSTARKLPDAGRAYMRSGIRIIRRFNVRQRRKRRRHAKPGELRFDVVAPSSGTLQPLAKAVRQSQLKANLPDGSS